VQSKIRVGPRRRGLRDLYTYLDARLSPINGWGPTARVPEGDDMRPVFHTQHSRLDPQTSSQKHSRRMRMNGAGSALYRNKQSPTRCGWWSPTPTLQPPTAEDFVHLSGAVETLSGEWTVAYVSWRLANRLGRGGNQYSRLCEEARGSRGRRPYAETGCLIPPVAVSVGAVKPSCRFITSGSISPCVWFGRIGPFDV
jgi:hypothetical protein